MSGGVVEVMARAHVCLTWQTTDFGVVRKVPGPERAGQTW